MDITLKARELNAILPSLVAVADKKNTSQPALEHLRFETGKRDVSIVAGDLNLWTFAEALATVTKPGKGTVSAKMFGDLVSKLDGDEVRLTVLDSFRLRVQCGKSKHEIPGMDPTLYPAVPEVSGKWKTVPGASLASGIGGVVHAVSTDETREHLRGVHVRHRDGRLEFTTSDGHRCARNFVDADLPGMEIVIPSKAAQEIARVADGAEKVDVASGKWRGSEWLFVRRDGVTVAAQLMANAFPVVMDMILSSDHLTSVEVDRAALLSALRRCRITGNQEGKKDPGAEMRLGGDTLTISAGVDCLEEIDAVSDGPDMRVGVNPILLIDAVSSIDGAKIKINAGGGVNPEIGQIIVRPTDGDDIRIVIPMRL